MHIDLTGQSVLVTGASRGIGAAVARQLGASGARVCIHYGTQREAAEALAAEIGHGAFAASKAGVVALTRSIARGFGKSEIKAFALAPGFTRTDMAQAFIDKYGEDFAASDIALRKLTEPGDIAPTVAFLLSGLADHATGTTIDLNAGSSVR